MTFAFEPDGAPVRSVTLYRLAAAETDIEELERRVIRAVFGYLERP